MAGARLLDLDVFVPKPVEVQIGGDVHRIPGSALTAELIIGLQELFQRPDDEDDGAFADMVDLLAGVVAKAEPPLEISSIPPNGLAPLAVFLVEAAGELPQEEAKRPTRARNPRASSTTRPSRARAKK